EPLIVESQRTLRVRLFIQEQIIRSLVIRHEYIQLAIGIEIGDDDSEPPSIRQIQTRLLLHLDEPSVPPTEHQRIERGFENRGLANARPTLLVGANRGENLRPLQV